MLHKGIVYKTKAEIEKMHVANKVVLEVLDQIEAMVRPGISTGDLSRRVTKLVKEHKVEPAFLGYGDPPYPAAACISVNDEVVHGIPHSGRILREGDIVSVDFGVAKDGYYGDAARTIAVGKISTIAQKLLDVTREALDAAIQKCAVGNRVHDISRSIQDHVEKNGFSVVRAFVGHGIGKRMHEEPPVPNFVDGGKNPRLSEGMVLAIEPMVNEGTFDVFIDEKDKWTAKTKDGKLSAHFEYSIAITNNGPIILGKKY